MSETPKEVVINVHKDFVTAQDLADVLAEHNAGTAIKVGDKTMLVATKSITIKAVGKANKDDLPPGVF